MASSSSGMGAPKFIEGSERPAADFGMAQFAVARRIFESGQQIEGDVGRLIVGRIRPRHISTQRTDGGLAREGWHEIAGGESRRGSPRGKAGGDGFHVSFHA